MFYSKCKCEENQPLHDWIMEQKEQRDPSSGMAMAFGKAASTIRHYPRQITSADEAKSLKHIGDVTARMIGQFLKAEAKKAAAAATSEGAPEADSSPAGSTPPAADTRRKPVQRKSRFEPFVAGPSGSQEQQPQNGSSAPQPAAKRNAKPREYVPQPGTASLALLITLYEAHCHERLEFLLKEDLITRAEASKIADKPIRKEGPATGGREDWWSGWSCMNQTLIKKGLVVKTSVPAKYHLTEEGQQKTSKWYQDYLTLKGSAPTGAAADAAQPDLGPSTSARETHPAQPASSRQKSAASHASHANVSSRMPIPMDADTDVDEDPMDDMPEGFCVIDESKVKTLVTLGHSLSHARAALAAVDNNLGEAIRLLDQQKAQTARATHRSQAERNTSQPTSANPAGNASQSNTSRQTMHNWSDDTAGVRLSSVLGEFMQPSDPAAFEPRLPPLAPGEAFRDAYDVVLLLDSRERFGKGYHHVVQEFLRSEGVMSDTLLLGTGDAVWVAKHRRTGERYVLDYILERKDAGDLSSSIIDGRYQRQKAIMLNCGVQNLYYLVEGPVPEDDKKVFTAMHETDAVHGFQLLRSADIRDTARRYAQLTKAIQAVYNSKRGAQYGASTLMTCAQFNEHLKKKKEQTVKDMWGLMLVENYGVGGEIAAAVTNVYETPLLALQALRQAGPHGARKALWRIPLRNRCVGPTAADRIYNFVASSSSSL